MIILHAQELGLVLLTTEVGHIVWSKRPLLPKPMMGRGYPRVTSEKAHGKSKNKKTRRRAAQKAESVPHHERKAAKRAAAAAAAKEAAAAAADEKKAAMEEQKEKEKRAKMKEWREADRAKSSKENEEFWEDVWKKREDVWKKRRIPYRAQQQPPQSNGHPILWRVVLKLGRIWPMTPLKRCQLPKSSRQHVPC